ncbi:MAG: DUF4157 domain-containing protein, partial [Actinomycetota bacterium]|nr:DUF4157 domain-containing protein [Actinomycetota bacterium]
RSLQADAFTVGSDVFFRGGLYQPGTGAGDRLLGHELAHVAIQSGHGLERMRSDVEAKRSESAARHEPINILRNATAGNVPEIRRAKKDDDEAKAGDSGAKGSKKKRRNALLLDNPASAPKLVTLEQFTKATKGNSLIHRGSFFTGYENASDVLKQKLKAYEALDDGKGLRDSNNRIRYTLLHEIEEICVTYLSKREVSRTKDHGDMESTDRESPGADNFVGEGFGEMANGKMDKILAIRSLKDQATKGKAVLKKAGLGRDAEDLEASANKDKKVTKMKKKYDPQTAGTFFGGLASVIKFAAGEAGESKEVEIKVMFELAPLVYVGVVVVVNADQDLNEGKGGPIHGDLELKGRLELGADLGVVKLEAGIDLGFFLEAQAVDAEQLASWFSLGAYDNFRSRLPESTVNYLWFGSGGENFNKAKADEWMARIDEALHVFPKENDEKYRAKKGESEEAKEKRTDALNEHRQAWAEQAQETYVRAGLVGGISGSAKVSLLKDKIDGAARGKRTGREGTTISAASLDEYVGYNSSDGNKKKEHDRSYSQRFASYAKEVEVSWAGWQGVYKTGANYVGEDRTEFWEGEFKIPAAWPASSIMALGSVLARSMRKHTKEEEGRKEQAKKVGKDVGKSLGIKAVFDSSDISKYFTDADAAQLERLERDKKGMPALWKLMNEENIQDAVLDQSAVGVGPKINDEVLDASATVKDLTMDGVKSLIPTIKDQSGFAGLSGGVVFKLKIEEKKGGGLDYHFIVATQSNTDIETPDALVKLGLKAKTSQTFFESKGTLKGLYDEIVEDLSYLGQMGNLNGLFPEMAM